MTGVLPIALDEARKLLRFMSKSPKEYVCVMELHSPVDEARLREVCSEFVGPIYQRPPLKASVKRRLRVRRIYELEVLEVEGRYALMKVGCEAGTYVRKLCHDIGVVLGVGAHMKELRRVRSGVFKEDETLVTLHDLKDAYDHWRETGDETLLRRAVQPMEKVVEEVPKIFIRDSAVDAICHGASLAAPGVLRLTDDVRRGSTVALMTQKGELVALAIATASAEEVLEAEHGIVATTKRVIMRPGTYPSMWRGRA